MEDLLVEIDTRTFVVTRQFRLTSGHEAAVAAASPAAPAMASLTCVPTWAQPSSDGASIYVACNKSNEIAVVDVATWRLVKRVPAGNGVYNLAMTTDGRLIATNKRGQSVSVFDPTRGIELVRLPTKRKVVHGAVVSPDNRYAFITVEGIGTDPGTLEVIDLDALQTVTRLDVPLQAAGIDFWKMEPARP
jgi:DNA-binding beta-propeller fold protein YncE